MAKQLRINYTSAYLKYQILKGAWFIHKNAAESQLPTVYDFLTNKLTIDDNVVEPELTQPYLVKLQLPGSATKRNISVIPIDGSLMKKDYCGAPGMQTIASRIRQAENNDSISGILLHIDSPGGTVDGTQELGSVVKKCKKPIVAFADGLIASAAYWIGSSSDMVIAKDTTTEIGSIGVVMSFVDNQKYYEQQGYEFHNIFADQSSEKWKEMLDAMKGDYSTIKEWSLNPLAEEFQETVKANRPNVKDKALKGRVFLAKDAKRLGLIDKIGDMEFAIKELNNLIDNKMTQEKEKVIEMTVPANSDEKSFFEKLGSYFKPEIKDISEETKQEYESKLGGYEKQVAELQEKLDSVNSENEKLKSEVEEIQGIVDKTKELNSDYDSKIKDLEAKNEELNQKLTIKIAETSQAKTDADTLEIGEVSEDEKAWLKEAEKMSKMF
jgi:protease-4